MRFEETYQRPIDMSNLTEKELASEIEKGLEDIRAGRDTSFEETYRIFDQYYHV